MSATRAFVGHYDVGVSAEPVAAEIAEELRRAAHDTRRQLRMALASPGSDEPEPPAALTAPLALGAGEQP